MCTQINGRRDRVYLGSGDPDAQAEMQAVEEGLRLQREEIRQAEQLGRQELGNAQRSLRAVGAVVGLALEASGYARYQRGKWQRRVMMKMKALPGPKANGERLPAKIRALVKIALSGDNSALDALQRISRLYPVAFASEVKGDLCLSAQTVLADRASAGNDKLYDDLLVRMRLEGAKLAGDDPSPAKQACASWAATMQAHAAILAMRAAKGEDKSGLLHAASREYQRALKTLAEIGALDVRRSRRSRPKVRVRATAIDATFKVIR
jgi:hypothetical protein